MKTHVGGVTKYQIYRREVTRTLLYNNDWKVSRHLPTLAATTLTSLLELVVLRREPAPPAADRKLLR